MEESIREFIVYLSDKKGSSYNTRISYERDLKQLAEYLRGQGVERIGDVSVTTLNSYVLYLERIGKAPSTVSRYIASLKSFFMFCQKNGLIKEDPAEGLKAPKVEKNSHRF